MRWQGAHAELLASVCAKIEGNRGKTSWGILVIYIPTVILAWQAFLLNTYSMVSFYRNVFLKAQAHPRLRSYLQIFNVHAKYLGLNGPIQVLKHQMARKTTRWEDCWMTAGSSYRGA